MGFGGISPWSLLLILLIVVLIFGTKRLKNVGGDLGGAIKAFKKSVGDGEAATKTASSDDAKTLDQQEEGRVVEGEVKDNNKV